MEIIILGVLLVALMVFVSTKIKKSAAEAFEAESIEKEDFSIEKPEGFLYPLRDKPEFPFEAYSKLYGERSTRNIWRARTRLRVSEGLNLTKLIKETKGNSEKITSEKNLKDLPNDQKGKIIRSEKNEDDVKYKILRKFIQSKGQNKTYELRTTILHPYSEEYTEKACEMMKSFVVK